MDLVPEPKKEILSATLRTSSIRATDSLLGLEGDLPSATAAMDVRAVVALTPIVPWLIRGTLPISRLKIRVDFSASFIRSLKFCTSGVKRGGRRGCVGSTGAGGGPEARESGCERDGCQEFFGAGLLCSRFLFLGTAPRDTNFG